MRTYRLLSVLGALSLLTILVSCGETSSTSTGTPSSVSTSSSASPSSQSSASTPGSSPSSSSSSSGSSSTEPSDDTLTIAEALALAAGDTATIKGTVAVVAKGNIVVYDGTGYFLLYTTSSYTLPEGLVAGAVIKASGTVSVYRNFNEFSSAGAGFSIEVLDTETPIDIPTPEVWTGTDIDAY